MIPSQRIDRRVLRTSVFGSIVAICVVALPARAQAPGPEEVKTAYLFNFARFVEWPPESAEDALNVCVQGDLDLYRTATQSLRGRQVGSRVISVQYVTSPATTAGCEILYIAPDSRERARRALAFAGRRPILTVGEAENFLALGGIIRFVTDAGTLQFEVNLKRANEAGLQISSQMLQFARHVRQE